MPVKLLLALCFLLCVKTTYSQVGLLSSNNKDQKEKQEESTNYPRLVSSALPDSIRLLRKDTVIHLHITMGIDTVSRLKESISKIEAEINYKESKIKIQQGLIAELKNNKADEEDKKKITLLEENIKDLQYQIGLSKVETETIKKALAETVMKNELSTELNAVLIEESINTRKTKFNEAISGLKARNQQMAADLYQNQYAINSNWFLIDSTKESFNKKKFLDSLSMIYSQIRVLSDQADNTGKQIEKSLSKYDEAVMESGKTIQSKTDYESLKALWNNLNDDIKTISSDLDNAKNKLDQTVKEYNSIVKNNIREKSRKEDKTPTEFGAFPQLTTILGKREVIPQLQLYGSHKTETPSTAFEGNIGLSFAASGTPDTNNLYNIFIASASKFLIFSNFTYSFWTNGRNTQGKDSLIKKLALRLDFSYAGKALVVDTVKSGQQLNMSVLYAKAGMELGILPKRFSIYANINTVTLMDKVDDFRDQTAINSRFLGFIDCGARFFLDPTPSAKIDDNLFIYANINFIINSGDVKRVTRTNDVVIPNLQFGLVKTLGKF